MSRPRRDLGLSTVPLDNSWDQNIELLAVDLKIDPLVPEYADKMNFYLTGLDDLERGPGDNPGIGQILCREYNRDVAE